MIGLTASAGVLITVGTGRVVLAAHEALPLVSAAMFLAIGMEPFPALRANLYRLIQSRSSGRPAAFGVPLPLVLAVLVSVLDLLPLIGSTLAGIVIALAALTVSLPVCLATVVFFLVLRWHEDYLLVSRVIGRTVQAPAVVTVVAVLIGGSILDVLGALLAIPAAASLLLLVRELLYPRLDRLTAAGSADDP